METFKFFSIFAIWCVLLWFPVDWLLWLSFTMKPYTETGKIIGTWIMHFLALTVGPFWATLFTLAAMPSGTKKKRS